MLNIRYPRGVHGSPARNRCTDEVGVILACSGEPCAGQVVSRKNCKVARIDGL